MYRTAFIPSALTHGPRPTEREIYIKAPVFRHQERPAGGQHG